MTYVYDPREDSYLLLREVTKNARGECLEIGTGSGILAIEASKKCNSVIAVDINKKAIENVKKTKAKIKFIHSDLFSKVPDIKFDTIILNPPYLPQAKKYERDISIEGGKKGYETIAKFLSQVNNYLKNNGKILLLFSSLTKKEKVDEFVERYGLESVQLSSQKLFFEKLYVYSISKTDLTKEIEKKGISNIEKIAKGQRGIVFKGRYKGKKVVIKVENKKSATVGRIQNEIKWLKILNKKKIGPKLLITGSNYFVADFIEGDLIVDYIKNNSKEKIISVILDVLNQCYIMDQLKVNKEEMHRPYKHIIIGRKPVMIDFERCRFSQKPKNVTQYCQFLTSDNIGHLLKEKNLSFDTKKLRAASAEYKIDISSVNLKKIKRFLK